MIYKRKKQKLLCIVTVHVICLVFVHHLHYKQMSIFISHSFGREREMKGGDGGEMVGRRKEKIKSNYPPSIKLKKMNECYKATGICFKTYFVVQKTRVANILKVSLFNGKHIYFNSIFLNYLLDLLNII